MLSPNGAEVRRSIADPAMRPRMGATLDTSPKTLEKADEFAGTLSGLGARCWHGRAPAGGRHLERTVHRATGRTG